MAVAFDSLTPDRVLNFVEQTLRCELTNLILPLPSYVNRVYEILAKDGVRYVVKFYRPERWNRGAIQDEHDFIFECQESEIPVIVPLRINGKSLFEIEGFLFVIFPKKAGRQFEMNSETDWVRLGTLLGRLHLVGQRKVASNRIQLHPQKSFSRDLEFLSSTIIPDPYKAKYLQLGKTIINLASPLFNSIESIRIHGDCHNGNILERHGEGLHLIDFDDMVMGQPVQDLWLLLPGRVSETNHEIKLFLKGYEQFRSFNYTSLKCIEVLRAMRMVYFLAWCSIQTHDYQFKKNFPDWGSDSFWRKETQDLQEQLGFVQDTLSMD